MALTNFDEQYGSTDPIAVIGMACRFPKAPNLQAYWQVLSTGTSCASHFTDQELMDAGISESIFGHNNFVARAAVIERPEYFDAELFGYSRQEAESIDPQQRLFLQTVWHAIEHAGYAPRNVPHKTGVYGAARMSTYGSLEHFSVTEVGQVKGMQALLGNDKDYLATRVAHRFNFKGPALTVQTACSSSLVAVHMASESLRSGECNMAIAGGTAVSFPQNAGYRYQQGMVFSPDGFCRPFSDRAEGTFGGNGVGAVVLKRLEDALEDGDPIMAVLRGSAVNNDGHDKVGFTAPSMQGQRDVIREALQLADVDPGCVGMIEAHGTGTTLGDPIEITALQKAYRANGGLNGLSANTRHDNTPCYIGSVKSNLGHLDTAAGIASLIKTVLAVHHGEIPKTLHVNRVNPKLQLDGARFAIACEKQSWSKDIRTAGVSSFGIGGTNCHMLVQSVPETVLQEARRRPPNPSAEAQTPSLLLAAASLKSLRGLAAGYAQALEKNTYSPQDLAFTAMNARQLDLPYRLALPLNHKASAVLSEAAKTLQLAPNTHQVDGLSSVWGHSDAAPKQVWLFTGQGSDYPGMGAELYRASPSFAKSLDTSAAVVNTLLGINLTELMFDCNGSQLQSPVNVQVAIVAFEIAMAAHWQSMGLQPDCVLGHSLGEYAAGVVAGYLDHQQVLALVVDRGVLVQECAQKFPGSGMVAVFATKDQLAAIPSVQELDLAAVNGEQYLVFSGPEQNINSALAALKTAQIAHRLMSVACAMHSKVLDSILDRFAVHASGLTLGQGSVPLISTLTGKELDFSSLNTATTLGNYWRDHLRQPVNYQAALAHAVTNGVSLFIEMGAQPHLINMGKREYRHHTCAQGLTWVASENSAAAAQSVQQQALHALYTSGCSLNWAQCLPQQGVKCRAPLYPFDEQYYWHQSSVQPANSLKAPNSSKAPKDNPFRSLSRVAQLPELLCDISNTKEIITKQKSLMDAYQQVHHFIYRCVGDSIESGITVGDLIRGGRLLPRYRDSLLWLLEHCVIAGIYTKKNNTYYCSQLRGAALADNTPSEAENHKLTEGLSGALYRECRIEAIAEQETVGQGATSGLGGHTGYQWCYEKVATSSKNNGLTLSLLYSPIFNAEDFIGQPSIVLSNTADTGLLILDDRPLIELAQNVLTTIKRLDAKPHKHKRIVVITHNAYPVKSDTVNATQYALAAFIRCIALEYKHCSVCSIDLDGKYTANTEQATDYLATIIDALVSAPWQHSCQLIYRDRQYYQCSLSELHLKNIPLTQAGKHGLFKQNCFHIVTGGMGGVGRVCIRWLAEQGVKHIAVLARRCHDDWHLFVTRIQQEYSCEIHWLACDVAKASELTRALDKLHAIHPVSGVLHAAGRADHTPVGSITRAHIEEIVSAKALGADVISDWLSAHEADYLVLFSSAAVMGAPGQGAYALANAYLDGLALSRTGNSENDGLKRLSISWGAWNNVGMTGSRELIKKLARDGMYTLNAAEALWHLEQALAHPVPHHFAMRIDTKSAIFGNYFSALSNAADESVHSLDNKMKRLDKKINHLDHRVSRAAQTYTGSRLVSENTETKVKNDAINTPTLNGDADKDCLAISVWLEQRIRYQLRLEPSTVLAAHKDLLKMGMDSLLFLELSTDIKQAFSVTIDAESVYENFTISALSHTIFKATGLSQNTLPEKQDDKALVIDKANRYKPFPLTPIQHAYWIGRKNYLNFGGVACQVVFEWDKSLRSFDSERFELAWNTLIHRHDMLRMVVDNNGEQRILSDTPVYRLHQRDYSQFSSAEKITQLDKLRKTLCQQVRPSETWPLFEVSITKIDDSCVRLHMNLDLLQFDVQSFKIMMDDLEKAYKSEPLAPIELSFRDYVIHEERQRNTQDWQDSWQYWNNLIPQLPIAPQLPLSTAPKSEQLEFFTLNGRLDRDDWEGLKNYWQEKGITPSAGLMSLFSETLGVFCRQPQFTLNMTFFNRQPVHPEVQDLIGDFTSVLLMDFDTGGTVSINKNMQNVQKKLWQNLAHSRINGVEVLRAFSRHLQNYNHLQGPPTSNQGQAQHNNAWEKSGTEPEILTPVVFTSMLGMSMEGLDIEQALTRFLGDPVFVHSQTPQVWLDHQIMEVDGDLVFNWYCMKDVLASGVLDSLFACYQKLLNSVASEPQKMSRNSASLFSESAFQTIIKNPLLSSSAPTYDGDIRAFEQSLRAMPAIYQLQCYPVNKTSSGQQTRASGYHIAVVANDQNPAPVTAALDFNGVTQAMPDAQVLDHIAQSWAIIESQALSSLCLSLQSFGLFAAEDTAYHYDDIVAAVQPAPQFVRLIGQWLKMLHREGLLVDEDGVFRATSQFFEVVSKVPEVRELIAPWCKDISQYLQQSIDEHQGLLKGRVSALEILFGEYDYTASLYANNPSLQFLNHNAALIIKALAEQHSAVSLDQPDFCLLEVGAGTAATSQAVLAEASQLIDRYHFTDVSDSFLQQAKVSLQTYMDCLHFDIFDINRAIDFGAHPDGGYDVILAVNVLHDAHHIYHCLNRLRKLLKPGGYLLLVEATDRHSAMQLATVGFIEGLNAFDDFRVADNNAMLDYEMWQQALQCTGFELSGSLPHSQVSPLRQHLMLAQSIRGGHLNTQAIHKEIQAKVSKPSLLEVFSELGPFSLRQYERLPSSGAQTADTGGQEISVPGANTATEVQPDHNLCDTQLELKVASIWQTFLKQPTTFQTDFFASGGDSLLATRMIVALQKAGVNNANLQPLFEHPVLRDFCRAISKVKGTKDHGNSTEKNIGVVGSAIEENQTPSDNAIPPTKFESTQGLRFPLTDLQRAYWLGETSVFELSSGIAHFYAELSVVDLDVERFNHAWNTIVQQHAQLRGIVDDGDFYILPEVKPYQARVTDLRLSKKSERDACLNAARKAMRQDGMPTSQWPLFDIKIYHTPDDIFVIHFVFDLVMADGISLNVIFQQLEQRYFSARMDISTDNPTTVADYMFALEAHKQTPQYEKSRQYWLRRIDHLPAAPVLPLAKGHGQRMNLSILTKVIAEAQWQALQQCAFKQNLTPSTVILTLFGRILAQWSETQHFCINILHANRGRDSDLPTDRQLVANLSTTNMLEMLFKPDEGFICSAHRIQEQLFDDLQHCDFNGQQVMRETNRRKHNLSAAMPVVFNDTVSVSQRSPMKLGALKDFGAQTPHVYLDCMLIAAPDNGVEIKWAVQLDYLESGVLKAMFEGFLAGFEKLISPSYNWANPLLLNLPPSQQALRTAVNNTHSPLGSSLPVGTLCDLVENGVNMHPQKTALVCAEGSLTYEQLWRQAQKVAVSLIKGTVKDAAQAEVVAVVMPKCWQQVVAVVAIHIAGKAYLPIDADYPQKRVSELLVLGEVTQVITHAEVTSDAIWAKEIQIYKVDSLKDVKAETTAKGKNSQRQTSAQSMLESARPRADDIAYVIFTSGSTGTPKGVVITHKSAVNTLLDINEKIGLKSTDAVLAVSSLSFDLSVFDIFSTLCVGAKLVIPQPHEARDPGALIDWVSREQVTVWNSVPAFVQMLHNYIDYSKIDPISIHSLRWIMMSGDWIPVQLPAQMQALHSDVALLSLGGATEAAIWSIFYKIEQTTPALVDVKPVLESSIPYGKPLANQTFFICNKLMDLCPTWVAGELYIGGDGLAEGYWKDKTKTDNAFIVHPHTGARLYKTGDIGRYLPDGNIEFLGRDDNQVKINGYRIELGEIEAVLCEQPSIKEALVDYVSAEDDTKFLAAYIVCADSDELLDQLRSDLASRLPTYMCPQHFVVLESMPYTSNGKIDRKSLPKPGLKTDGSCNHNLQSKPQTETEVRVAELWQDVLKLSALDKNRSFFELGGHSLLAVQLIARTRLLWQCDVSAGTLQHNDTVALFAAYLDRHRFEYGVRDGGEKMPRNNPGDPAKSILPSSLVPLKRRAKGQASNRPNVFIIHPIGGHLLSYQRLSQVWSSDAQLYGLQLPSEFVERENWSVPELAAYYRALIVKHQPQGPYNIAGWSFGGVVAYELGRQLESLGLAVSKCILIDSFVPHPRREVSPSGAFYLEHFLIDFLGRFPEVKLRKPPSCHDKARFLNDLYQLLQTYSHFKGLGKNELSLMLETYRVSLMAMLSYRVKRSNKEFPIHLIKAKHQHRDDFMSYLDPGIANHKTHGWSEYADVHTYELEGDHYTLFAGQQVDALASTMDALLRPVASLALESANHASPEENPCHEN